MFHSTIHPVLRIFLLKCFLLFVLSGSPKTPRAEETPQGPITTGMIVIAVEETTYPLPGPGFQTLGSADLSALLCFSHRFALNGRADGGTVIVPVVGTVEGRIRTLKNTFN